MRYTGMILCILLVISCSGCRLVWTDDIFAVGLLTDIQTQNSSLQVDPNGLSIQAGSYGSETDNIKVRYNPIVGAFEVVTD